MVILFYFNAFFIEVYEYLIGVIVLAGIPDLDELRRDLDDDLGVLVGILVIAVMGAVLSVTVLVIRRYVLKVDDIQPNRKRKS